MAGALTEESEARPLSPPSAGTLTIDLGALAANWRQLRDRAASSECAAVVKADAYGIGIEPAVRTLWAAGCRTFFVAHLTEAARAKAVAPDAIVYVLNGLPPGTAPAFFDIGARPVLGSVDEVRDWASACAAADQLGAAAVHVDTGMNRLGLSMADAVALSRDPIMAGFEAALLMSHFVSAEEAGHPVTSRQIAAFEMARDAFPTVPASLANSSGIFLPARPHFDLVRPGYALYGGNPTPGVPNPMMPVVRLETPILQTRAVAAGETVGYGAGWTARSPRRLATLSVGYGDGYPRAAGLTDTSHNETPDRGAALVAGRLCPFLGRVSMDLVVIDVTAVPPDLARRGSMATLIGDGLDIDEVGRRAGTIGYEILTGLGRRYARTYVNG